MAYAKAFPNDPDTGKPQFVTDLSKPLKFDCGACAASTASDYLRFAQMLLNGGRLDGRRVLSRKTVEYMLSNQLGPNTVNLVANADRTNADMGFGGLGVAVRTTPGIVPKLGSVGEFTWPGAYGTNWWADPKEQRGIWTTLSILRLASCTTRTARINCLTPEDPLGRMRQRALSPVAYEAAIRIGQHLRLEHLPDRELCSSFGTPRCCRIRTFRLLFAPTRARFRNEQPVAQATCRRSLDEDVGAPKQYKDRLVGQSAGRKSMLRPMAQTRRLNRRRSLYGEGLPK